MNRCCGGKPRAGKTKRVVMWLEEQLRSHTRPIVTNMAIEMGPWVDGKGKPHKGLVRTLQDKYGETFDVERRLHILKHEEVPRFYAVRPEVPKDSWEPAKVKVVPRSDMWKFDANQYSNCCYAIDEAEVYFPSSAVDAARANHEDPELLQWAKQAGRAGDEAIFLSQNLVWISIKLRKSCQECWWMVNHVHIPMWVFRRPDHITEETYMNCPPNPGETYLRKTKLVYNREEVEGCYDTAKGVGVTGNSAADIGQRAKGLHWGFIPAGIVLLGILALFGLRMLGDTIKASYGRGTPRQVASGTNGVVLGGQVGKDGFTDVQRAGLFAVFGKLTNYVRQDLQKATVKGKEKAEEPVEGVVGLVRGKAGVVVCLDDGSRFLAREVEEFGREVAVDGIIYKRVRGEAGIEKEGKRQGK